VDEQPGEDKDIDGGKVIECRCGMGIRRSRSDIIIEEPKSYCIRHRTSFPNLLLSKAPQCGSA